MRTSPQSNARLSVIAGVLGLLALQAQAQTSPWYAGVNQRFEHHSNLFQSSGGGVSDTVSSTSLVGGVDLPISRQRLYGRLTAGTNRYSNNTGLNHESYTGVLGLDWETAGRLSGTLALDASQTLADFNPPGFSQAGLPAVISNNATDTVGLRGSVRMGVVTRLTAEVGGATRRTRFDNALYQSRNVDIDEVYALVRYRPAGSLVVGGGVRATRGTYPNFRAPVGGGFTPENFERNNVDLIAEWPVSGASRVDARLSFGKDSYDTITTRDYSGVTGEFTWRWQPTGRTALTTVYTRRSGDEVGVSNIPGQATYATSANRVSDTVGVSADYELTGKMKVRATASLSDSSAVDQLGRATDETNSAVSLGLVWEATRAIRAGCDVTVRNRSNGVSSNANVFGCFGEFVLR